MCPSESLVIRYVAGELSEPEASLVTDHASACDACRQLLARHQALWDTLADGMTAVPERDLTRAILTAASRPALSGSPWRIAAAVLVAVGAGIAAGAVVPVPSLTAVSITTDADADAAAFALGLDAIVVDQTGLTLPVTAPSTPVEEEPS